MKYRKKNWIYTLTVVLCFIKVVAPDQVKLLRDLFDEGRYDSSVRPVKNINTTTTITFGMTLNQIRELVETTQTLTCAIWGNLYWQDEFLTWDPEDYDGLDLLVVPSSNIWTPDMTLYNSVDEERGFTEIWSDTNVRISPNGQIDWMTVAQTQTTCRLQLMEYPFDEQLCPLKFGSWTFQEDEVDVVPVKATANIDKFIDNEEWDLVNVTLVRHSLKYVGGTFSDITAYVHITRKPNFYLFALVFPCVLLMVISVAVFWLPSESGEKVSLGVTVLLALTVYQLIITDNIPSTAEYVPLLAQFFGASIVLLAFSVMSAVCVLNLHFYGCFGARVPKPIRSLMFGCCAPFLCLGGQSKYLLQQIEELEPKQIGADGKVTSMSYHYTRRDHVHDVPIVKNGISKINGNSNGNTKNVAIGDTLNKSLEELRMARLDAKSSKQEDERSNLYVQEWQLLACVIDRLLFLIFVIATIVSSVLIFRLRPTRDDPFVRLAKMGY